MNLITALLYASGFAFILAYLTARYQKRRGLSFFPAFFKAFVGFLGVTLLVLQLFA